MSGDGRGGDGGELGGGDEGAKFSGMSIGPRSVTNSSCVRSGSGLCRITGGGVVPFSSRLHQTKLSISNERQLTRFEHPSTGNTRSLDDFTVLGTHSLPFQLIPNRSSFRSPR